MLRKLVESPSLKVLTQCVDVTRLGVCFDGGVGSARLMVEINDHRNLFNPKLSYDSVVGFRTYGAE